MASPFFDWINVNTDGAANRVPSPTGYGGTFRPYWDISKGCFAKNIYIFFSLENVLAFGVELMGLIIYILSIVNHILRLKLVMV